MDTLIIDQMFVVSLHRNSVQTCLAFEGYKSGELRGNRILFLYPFFTPSSPPLFFFSFDHHVLLCVDRTHFRPVLLWNRCSQCTRCASKYFQNCMILLLTPRKIRPSPPARTLCPRHAPVPTLRVHALPLTSRPPTRPAPQSTPLRARTSATPSL
jgi:hypothetical protein